ncbi:MAG: hypothetical protein ABR543_16965 [Gemmatimonadaceae bacterium]
MAIVALAAGLSATGFAIGSANTTPRLSEDATGLDGRYWVQLSPKEKQAYLTGFVAGAAAEQVRSEAKVNGRESDSAAVSSAAVKGLKKSGTLQFRFAPAVYLAQISDFYWYENHVDTPLMDVMIFWNNHWLELQKNSRSQ